MNTITIECGRGLQSILIEILKPIKMNKTEVIGSNSRLIFELIGVEDNPVQKLKDYGNGVFECLDIMSVD